MRKNVFPLIVLGMLIVACSGADDSSTEKLSGDGEGSTLHLRGSQIVQDGVPLPPDSVAGQYSLRCMGTTLEGERCKRKVTMESDYCWQHAGQVTEGEKNMTAPSSAAPKNDIRTIQTGPRGGQYYINKNGKKTYIKKKK